MTDKMIDFKRKALFIILTLCLIFSVSKAVNAEEAAFAGVPETTIGNMKYSITADGHLTVEGKGNYGSSPAWLTYKDYIVKATVNLTDITNTENMFSGCSNLKTVDLTGLNTSKVTKMAAMFKGCSSLQSLNLSHFDTRNVTDMSWMFSGCYSLQSLIVKGTNFNTAKVTEMDYMFSGCSSLRSLDVSGLDVREVITMPDMFKGCDSLITLELGNFKAAKATNMSYMFSECKALETINLIGFEADCVENLMCMFDGAESLKTIVFDKNFDTTNVTTMYGIFQRCTSLESVDLRYFNTSNVTDMYGVFADCTSLKSVDLSNFNTGNLIYTSRMFANCKSLEALDLSNFDVSKVHGMYQMFMGCSNLKTLNLSGFTTSSGTSMLEMFSGCSSLQALDLRGFDTRNVSNMDYMFSGCNSLKELDLSTFVISSTYLALDKPYKISAQGIEKFTSGKEKRLYALYTTAVGWVDANGNRYADDTSIELEPNTTLYRLNDTYNIKYVYEGELENAQSTYKLDKALELTGVVNHEHCTFEGWYKDAQLTEEITEIPAGTYGDITLYAKLIPNTYSITYMNIEDVTNAEKLPDSYVYGKLTPIATPLKVCYLFDGWYTDEKLTDGFDNITKTTGGDFVLYAKWKPNHDLDKEHGVVIKEATTIAEGEIRYRCKYCDYTETEIIPRIVTDESQITDETILNKPNDSDIEGSDFTKFQARAAKTTKNSVRLKWNKIEGADGYKIYGNKCGKNNRFEFIKKIKGSDKISWTQKKRKKGTYYKYIVRAYKIVDGQEITVAVSKTIHVTTTGGKKGNAKSVKIKTDKKMKKASGGYKLTLKKNKKYTIKASEVAREKKISIHRNVRFDSSNPSIATVSKKGVVKAVSRGTCYIYAYAQNGVYKKIKVVVK